MTKFELDLLKEFSDDGCGGDDFDEISTLVGMRMRGYFQDAEDDETIDELIERYEECISRLFFYRSLKILQSAILLFKHIYSSDMSLII